MTTKREEQPFDLVLEKPPAERPTFLDAVCGDDTSLRQRVEALLSAHDQPATDLNEPGITSDEAPPSRRGCSWIDQRE